MSSDRPRPSRRDILTWSLTGIGAIASAGFPAAAAAAPDRTAADEASRPESPPAPGSAGAAAETAPGMRHPSGALRLYHIHTAESLEIEYRRGNAIITSALGEIDHLLRDFRTEQETMIDLDVLDTLSMLYDQFGRRGRFEIISGFRSPRTNAALRRITTGVAEDSFHMAGRAIDVRLVGTYTNRLRDAALALGRGGVGYYPESNFVHVDTGTVRSW